MSLRAMEEGASEKGDSGGEKLGIGRVNYETRIRYVKLCGILDIA